MDALLTVQEAAEYLRVSRTTAWRWCKEGKLPAFKVGRDWRIRRSEFEKLIGETSEGEKDQDSRQNISKEASQESQTRNSEIKPDDT